MEQTLQQLLAERVSAYALTHRTDSTPTPFNRSAPAHGWRGRLRMSATQQVITIDDISAENAPVIYVAGGLKQFFEHAKTQATGEVPETPSRSG
jgi:hypothetical protein